MMSQDLERDVDEKTKLDKTGHPLDTQQNLNKLDSNRSRQIKLRTRKGSGRIRSEYF